MRKFLSIFQEYNLNISSTILECLDRADQTNRKGKTTCPECVHVSFRKWEQILCKKNPFKQYYTLCDFANSVFGYSIV